RRFPVTQENEGTVDKLESVLGELGVFATAFRLLLEIIDALFQAIEIGQHQLGFDRLDVGNGVDLALHVGDIAVLKTAYHVHDRVDLANGGEKLVAEAFALGRAPHEPGNIDERDARRNDLRRLPKHRKFVQTPVPHRNLADIRLDRAEWVV